MPTGSDEAMWLPGMAEQRQADEAPSVGQALVCAVKVASAGGRQARLRRRTAELTWPSPPATVPGRDDSALRRRLLGPHQGMTEPAGVAGQGDAGLDGAHAGAAELAVALVEAG